MPRSTRYRTLEKNIAASDTGGIRERWHYGCLLLADSRRTTPAGNLKHGVLAELIGIAAKCGIAISEREIQWRLKCARTYRTEAEIRNAITDFKTWFALTQAGFPSIHMLDPDEPHDPRTDAEKRDDEKKNRSNPKSAHPTLFDWNPPHQFRGDEHGPRSSIKELYQACEESERYTAGMAAYDARRRGYVDELAAAVGGDTEKTWYEGEQRRKGLKAVGLTSWDDFSEIMDDFFNQYDSADTDDDSDAGDDDDLDDDLN
jgi:hypothetical protein